MNSLPKWIKTVAPGDTENEHTIGEKLDRYDLHTICEEADCPNQGECWRDGTATFLLLGDTCTRNCRFCDVSTGDPEGEVNENEPDNLARAVDNLGLDYVVLTSVDRDDLPDFGAGIFQKTIQALLDLEKSPLVEALIPDFSGKEDLIEKVATSGVHVVGHNVETVRRLTPEIRDPRAGYDQSLYVLKAAKNANPSIVTKSSLMVGLGEKRPEIIDTMKDLKSVDVDILTIGQYLRPTTQQFPVSRYLELSQFDELRDIGRGIGFSAVMSGPFVRSSYKAKETYLAAKDR